MDSYTLRDTVQVSPQYETIPEHFPSLLPSVLVRVLVLQVSAYPIGAEWDGEHQTNCASVSWKFW